MSPVTTMRVPKPQAREEHLHLLGSGVLRLVEHDERIVERAPAHVCQRRDLDRAARHELGHEFGIHHLVEGVVQRTQIGIDLVVQGAWQEAEPFARLHGGPGQDDATDLFALSACTALAIARYVLPVPAGPMPNTIVLSSIAST